MTKHPALSNFLIFGKSESQICVRTEISLSSPLFSRNKIIYPLSFLKKISPLSFLNPTPLSPFLALSLSLSFLPRSSASKPSVAKKKKIGAKPSAAAVAVAAAQHCALSQPRPPIPSQPSPSFDPRNPREVENHERVGHRSVDGDTGKVLAAALGEAGDDEAIEAIAAGSIRGRGSRDRPREGEDSSGVTVKVEISIPPPSLSSLLAWDLPSSVLAWDPSPPAPSAVVFRDPRIPLPSPLLLPCPNPLTALIPSQPQSPLDFSLAISFFIFFNDVVDGKDDGYSYKGEERILHRREMN